MSQVAGMQLWKEVIELVEHFLEKSALSETAVVNYLPATELKEKLALRLGNQGCTDAEFILEIKNYLTYSQNSNHPYFHNQLNAGSTLHSVMAEIVAAITNTTMSTFEVAPVATLIEQKLIEEIADIIGFEGGDGIMLTGGSNANMMAIHAARIERFPEIKHTGNSHHRICVFVSREAHYSHKKAMMLLGLGLDNLVLVEADSEGRMMPTDLEAKIISAISDDKIPLMLCSTAGTTVLGAFDPILENHKIGKKYGLWHHVDGAWGGAVMLSKKYSHLLEGLSEVDSFTFDAHKLLGTGLITSFFLTKKKDALLRANSVEGAQYLFHDYENAQFDTGIRSQQCGRKVDSLKLWLSWKALGHQGMEALVDGQFAKAAYFTQLIQEHSRLKLVHQPEFLNVCFQVLPKDESVDINRFNYDLRFKVVKTGKMMINYSSFKDGTIFFRQVFANQRTTNEDLNNMLQLLLEMADT